MIENYRSYVVVVVLKDFTISTIRINKDDITTELVDACPTPTVPLDALKPLYEPTAPTINPKNRVLAVLGR